MAQTKIKILGGYSDKSRPSVEWRGGYFFTYDPDCTDYDWLAVLDELPSQDNGTFVNGYEPLRCPRERTVLATWEPVTIKSYSRAYTRQFGHFLSNRPPEAEKHPHYQLGRGYYYWYCGRQNPDEVLAAGSPVKTRDVSACCSAKRMRFTLHDARYRLIEELARQIPGFDWYGLGIRPLDRGRKFDALDSYRYHIAVENHIAPDYWTEKIADAWLCECLPFYAGDPNLESIMPAESFVRIPIDDPAEAVRIVRAAIADGAYEKRREAVLEAKRLVLEKYNFWAQVVSVIESARNQAVSPVDSQNPFRLYARRELRKHSLAALGEDAWSHLRRIVFTGRC